MSSPAYQPLMHRFALATACLALLPIAVGALVTTVGAGMAFLDWPSSDGHNMLLYPWLRSLAEGRHDKFIEHGHRLAGMLIGMMSIGLVVVAWMREPRRWVRVLAALVLAGVIVQGLLGGVRVLRDDPRMAMVHGGFAAVVFTLMAATALVTGRGWLIRQRLSGKGDWLPADSTEAARGPKAEGACPLFRTASDGDARLTEQLSRKGDRHPSSSGHTRTEPQYTGASPLFRTAPDFEPVSRFLKTAATVTPLVILVQYLLGGMLRHLGTALYEHLAVAFIVLACVLATVLAAHRTGQRWLQWPAWAVLALLGVQLLLGAGAWLTKFGLASAGWVAVQHSTAQIAFRTSHTVVGMLLFMASVLLALRVWRVAATQAPAAAPPGSPATVFSVPAAARGGVG